MIVIDRRTVIERRLVAWLYTVSCSQFLFRSVRKHPPIYATQLDLIFTNVSAIRGQLDMNLLWIAPSQDGFELSHKDGTTHVAALSAVYVDTDQDYFDPSPLLSSLVLSAPESAHA